MSATASSALRTALAVLLLALLVPLPDRPGAYIPSHFLPPPADLAVIVLMLCLLPRGNTVPRALLVAALAALTLWRVADLGMVLAFRRGFNPVLDLHLLASGWELGAGTFGPLAMGFGVAGGVLAIAGLVAVLHWALGGIPRLPGRARIGVGVLALVAIAVGPGPVLPDEAADRAERLRIALAEERRFAAELARDELATPDFAALRGHDVIVLFVESYGRAWLDGAAHGATGRARLAAAEERLARAGFAMRSAWVTAPTRGGQSWLAHGAAMSGLWTSSQVRYDALIASDRASLNALFARAGWRTAAVMPAITRAWPEAAWYGYDEIHDRDGLGYRGEPFEWVTMPDQYTLTALDRLTRGRGPVMVEAALITSHAPWTPLPEILPWESVGDGAVFDGTRRSGASPRQVWSAPETIRAAWSRALDYSLEVVAQWIARSAGDALVVVLGDHQPAPLVTGDDPSAAVPLHVIARDPALLQRLPGAWSEGLRPAPDLPERPMTEIRRLLADCYSTGGCSASESG